MPPNNEWTDRAAKDPFSAAYSDQVRSTGKRPPIGSIYTSPRRASWRHTGAVGPGAAGGGGGGVTGTFADGMGGSPNSGGGRSSAMVSTPIYYDPRYSTPDKFNYPRTEVQANAIWRHLYTTDPATGVATDVYADLPWSDFDITGIDDRYVSKFYESMLSDLNLLSVLPDLSREYLMLGKVVPHLIFDAAKGYWSGVIAHNPDYVNVRPIPVPGYEPILDLKPTPELREFALSPDPRMRDAKRRLPGRILQYAIAGLPIPLDPINVTYLARKTNLYAYVGTSLYSRLYRTQMLEDFLANATLAVAQRNAAPLRLFKLGDPQTGWYPDKADEQELLNMLAIAETDPFAAIVYHYGIQVEYIGVSDRLMSVSKEWDYLERVKFLALGISKAFLLGEASFASAYAGLQTLVERLQTFRRMFVSKWIEPKILKSVAKMHEFYRRPEAQITHRIRIRLSDDDLIVPTLQWKKRLDPTQDPSVLSFWQQLVDRGIMSERTLVTGAGGDYDNEQRQIFEDAKKKKAILDKHPDLVGLVPGMMPPGGGGLPPGLGPGGPGMGLPPMGGPGAGRPIPHPPGPPRHASRDTHRFPVASDVLRSRVFDAKGYHHGVHFSEIEPIAEILMNGYTDDPTWSRVAENLDQVRQRQAARDEVTGRTNPRTARVGRNGDAKGKGKGKRTARGGRDVEWSDVEDALMQAGYLDIEIEAVQRVLKAEGAIGDGDPQLAEALAQAEGEIYGDPSQVVARYQRWARDQMGGVLVDPPLDLPTGRTNEWLGLGGSGKDLLSGS